MGQEEILVYLERYFVLMNWSQKIRFLSLLSLPTPPFLTFLLSLSQESFIAFENALLGRDMYPGLDKWSIYLGEFIRVLASECPDSGAALHKHVVIRLGDAFDALVEAERYLPFVFYLFQLNLCLIFFIFQNIGIKTLIPQCHIYSGEII